MNSSDTDIPIKDLWSVHVGGHNRGPRAGGSNNRIYFLTVRRLEVQGQGVGRDGFFGGLPPWLGDAVFSLCPQVVFPPCASAS